MVLYSYGASKRGFAPLSFFPLWQRGTKGDLKSLSISLYEREKSGFIEFKKRGTKGVRSHTKIRVGKWGVTA